ncbi:hypothetical protein OPV22_025594 [Ensete ventricosum]|uniref:Uncharacterized protein n=1 Tax=Ensete ventricosum TaxID=4639 RepID=A0AAV8P9S4_ENSVE|nr:hypothetical protein OPV22_025594 [Ensete ventricosum]
MVLLKLVTGRVFSDVKLCHWNAGLDVKEILDLGIDLRCRQGTSKMKLQLRERSRRSLCLCATAERRWRALGHATMTPSRVEKGDCGERWALSLLLVSWSNGSRTEEVVIIGRRLPISSDGDREILSQVAACATRIAAADYAE